jgi:hypothetical protein
MADIRQGSAEGLTASVEKHGRDLKQVNVRLRELISSLEQQRGRLAAGMRLGDARLSPGAPAPAPADAGNDPERARLRAALAEARAQAEQAAAEHARLMQRLAEIEKENRRACDEVAALQDRTADVMHLYVTLERLHRGLTRGETLVALQEIVINILGSEEFALFEARDGVLRAVHTFGMPAAVLADARAGRGAIGRAAEGCAWFAPGDAAAALEPGEQDLTIALPLRAGDGIVAVLAVFRLLPHKAKLSGADLEVLSLLETHAGMALALRPPATAAA